MEINGPGGPKMGRQRRLSAPPRRSVTILADGPLTSPRAKRISGSRNFSFDTPKRPLQQNLLEADITVEDR